MSEDLPDEWLVHLWWRDFVKAWEQIGLAIDEWSRLYEPFIPKKEEP